MSRLLTVDNFGGLNTLQNATDVPQYVSPDCQNIEYIPGRVQKRPGTSIAFASTNNVSKINYTKSYVNLNGDTRNIGIDNAGNLFYEDVTNAPGVTTFVVGGFLPNLYPNSTTLFGREWIAFGDGQQGQDLPRRYNGVTVNRVTQDGPGAAPTVVDSTPPTATIGNPGGGTSRTIIAGSNGQQAVGLSLNPFPPPKFVSTHVLVTTTVAHGFSVGNIVTITGAAINGTYVITATTSTTFQFAYTMANGGSVPVNLGGNGTATVGPPATTTMARTSNTMTAYTTAAHGFAVGWTVQVSGISAVAIGGAASGSQALGIVTISTATAHGLVPGATAIVAGMTDTTYNGTWTVASVPTPTTFTYAQTTTNASTSSGTVSSPINGIFTITGIPSTASFTYKDYGPDLTSTGTGTATILGNISPGTHQLTVQFLLDDGTLTQPAPPVMFIAGGGKMISVSNIAIGPANVTGRYISITPLSSGQFFYIAPSASSSGTIISDNTSTNTILDFRDTDLLDGVNINSYFDSLVLGEVIGFAEYASRLVAIGQTNKIINFNNLGFDGGFSQDSNVCPLGWTPDATNYVGGGKSAAPFTGDAYSITGDGVHTTQGMITQSAAKDYLSNPILSPATAYTLSFYASKTNTLTGANLLVQLFSTSASYSSGITVAVGTQLQIGVYSKFTFNCTTLPSPVPSDLVVRIYGTNLSNGDSINVDAVQFFPTLNPIETSVVRFSNVEDPQNFNGLTGFIQPTEENGQAVRATFILRDFFYIVKERSMFVTRDDGQNEPSDWSINEVSSQVGTPSVRGIGIGDEWVVIAAQSGLWLFMGGRLTDDYKLSKEIQPTWDSINWSLGQLIDVKVDTKRKRVYVNVPIGATATQNNTLLTLDYTEGWMDPEQNGGIGRKWCPWTIQANCINLCLQQDESQVLYCGNNFKSGYIYKLDPAQLNDYDISRTPIDAYWQSGYFQQAGQRLNFSFINSNSSGVGNLQLLLRIGDQSSFYPIRGWTLNPLGLKNMERQIQKQHYRMAVRFEMTDLDSTFSIQGFSVTTDAAVYAPVRGTNQ